MTRSILFIAIVAGAMGGCSTIQDSPQKKQNDNFSILVGDSSIKDKLQNSSISLQDIQLSTPAKSRFTENDYKAQEYTATAKIFNCTNGFTYVALPALPTDTFNSLKLDPVSKKYITTESLWPTDAVGVNELLTNISTNTNIGTTSIEGGFASLFSAKYVRKQYVIDFMKWRGELLTTTNGEEMGWVRLGAGLRLNIDITTSDANATGSLMALAISAKSGKTTGSISAELIGMDSKEVTQVSPFSVDLSEGNITKIIETMATVKAKLYDTNIKIRPNLIAKIVCTSKDMNQIIN